MTSPVHGPALGTAAGAAQGSPGGAARGPLHGLRVLELAGEFSAFPGKLLADLGANVIVVEQPCGSVTRTWGPFAAGQPTRVADTEAADTEAAGTEGAEAGRAEQADQPAAEASLHWRHYNTSKRSVVLNLTDEADRGRFQQLLADCDVLLEGLSRRELAEFGLGPALGLEVETFGARYPALVWVSVTPFGRRGSPPDIPTTDLTLMAGGGPVQACGYDDHSLPPVRGAGGQSAHVAGYFAVAATLTALLHRTVCGRGQHVDVSVDAALNVTCELATTQYLADGGIVQRQTGRHAMVEPTSPTQVRAADGHYVVLGFPPRAAEDYASIVEWIDSLGLRDEFPDVVLLELGVERGGVSVTEVSTDPLAMEIWNASRAAMILLAERLPAYDFFLGCQRRGMVAGFVAAPEEAIRDPHLVARGFATEVTDPHTGRTEIHPGPPYRFSRTPWRIHRPAPRLGEHTESVLKHGWSDEPS